MLIERLNAFTLLKSVDSAKLFQALIILHAKKRLLAELVLLGLYLAPRCDCTENFVLKHYFLNTNLRIIIAVDERVNDDTWGRQWPHPS